MLPREGLDKQAFLGLPQTEWVGIRGAHAGLQLALAKDRQL